MILIINICKEKLHYLEFVRPIEEILKNTKEKYFTKHYLNLKRKDIEKSEKIIICGTSLQDNSYLKNIDKFKWIKKTNKKILGICAGMQIICLIFDGKLKTNTEIGLMQIRFKKEFLGLEFEKQVYNLHNLSAKLTKDFEIFAEIKYPQAAKHRKKEIYCTLFHPEVRQKDLIRRFINQNKKKT